MDPYEHPGHLPGGPGDPGDRSNYRETQEEHSEDMQIERKKEIGAKWTKNKEKGATNGTKDDVDANNKDEEKDEEDDNSMHETNYTEEAKTQRYHKTNRQKETWAKRTKNKENGANYWELTVKRQALAKETE